MYVYFLIHPSLNTHTHTHSLTDSHTHTHTHTLLLLECYVLYIHRVLNTDNMSIIGLTIDYGPYGFMDKYDPGHICNTSGKHMYIIHARYSIQFVLNKCMNYSLCRQWRALCI